MAHRGAEQENARFLRHMDWTLHIIANQVFKNSEREEAIMAVGQDILDAVTVVDTKIGSALALLQGLVNAGTIPQSVVDAIKAKIKGSEDQLDAAIAANTAPPPV